MCGFFQVVQKKTPVNKERFVNALRTMTHRGPDGEGVHFEEATLASNEKVYMGFGHKRLSILDLDPRSNQPYHSGDHILLYNGEVYNYQSIRMKYQKEQIDFRTKGDTEVVMQALVHGGKNTVSEFNGMWALSLFDRRNKSFFFSRDRYGKKPLFYYLDNDTFCVSSTVKAIKSYLGIDIRFNHDVLVEYMLTGTMYPSATASTHFDAISQLLPGYHGYFNCETWSMDQENYFDWFTKQSDTEHTHDALKETLQKSVELRLVSDRPVGLLLSGGIDSSLILSILHYSKLHDNVKIYMGDTGRSEDYTYAKKCVRQLGIDAKTIKADYDTNAFKRFLNVCAHHEKAFPFNGNAIAMPQMFEEVSADGVPVVLDGSGGDEIFGGYWERHMPYAMNDARAEGNDEWIAMMVEANGSKNQVRKNAERSRTLREFRRRKDAIKKNLYDQFNPFLKAGRSHIWGDHADPLTDLGYGFNEALCRDIAPGGRLGEWVWHNDRNSMMYSVESRSPFLDVHLHQFIFSSYSDKYHQNWNKYELRKIFDSFTPLPTQWRAEKQGFRWDGKHFFNNNRKEIMELISQSRFLSDVMNVERFVSVARRYPNILRSSLGKRALCIAGIEHALVHGV